MESAAAAPPPGVTIGNPVPAGVTLGAPTSPAPPPGVTLAPPKPPAAPGATPPTPNPIGEGYTDLYKGVYKGAAETLGGVMSLLNRDEAHPDPAAADAYRQANPGSTPEEAIAKTMTTPDPRGHIHAVQSAADWLRQHAQATDVMQSIGKMGEGMGEFLIPGLQEEAGADAVAKVPTYAQKASEAAEAAKFLEKSALGQRLAGLASIGLRTIRAAAEAGAGVGAQTYAKTGGDTAAAARAAIEGAVAGGVLHGGTEALAAGRTAAAGRAATAAAHEAAPGVQAERTAAMLADRQARAQQGIKDVARDATENALTRLNDARQPITVAVPGARVAAREGAGTIREDLTAKGAASRIGAAAGAVPTSVVPKNPIVEELGSQAGTIPGRIWDEVATPATEATTPPNFAPVDAGAIAADTNSFGHAAEKIREAAQPVYQALDDATDGRFAKLQKSRATAYRASNFERVDALDDQIDELLAKKPAEVNGQDYAAARSAWRDSKVLDRLHAVTEGAFNGITEAAAAEPGTSPRLLRGGNSEGGSLQTRLGAFLRNEKNIRDAQRVIGPDGVANLYRASHLVSNPETAKATQEIADEVAKQFPAPKPPGIGRKVVDTVAGAAGGAAAAGAAGSVGVPPWAAYPVGAAGGAGVAEGARFVLRRMLTSPRVGQLMEYAVQNRVSPKIAAGLISAQIQREEQAGK